MPRPPVVNADWSELRRLLGASTPQRPTELLDAGVFLTAGIERLIQQGFVASGEGFVVAGEFTVFGLIWPPGTVISNLEITYATPENAILRIVDPAYLRGLASLTSREFPPTGSRVEVRQSTTNVGAPGGVLSGITLHPTSSATDYLTIPVGNVRTGPGELAIAVIGTIDALLHTYARWDEGGP